MASQNLVSASIAAETKAAIMKDLADIRVKLNFLLSLPPDDRKFLFKVGNGYAPLLDKAFSTVADHPEIMPAVFDMNEFKKDYALYKDLIPIQNQVDQLAEGISNTITAVASDTLQETLDIYAAVKQNKDRVSGLGVVADEMGEFFKHQKKSTGSAKAG